MKTVDEMLFESGIPHWQPIYIQPGKVLNDHEHYQRQVVPAKLDKLRRKYPNTDQGRLDCYAKFKDGIVAARFGAFTTHGPRYEYYMINGQHHSLVAAEIGVPYLKYYVFFSEGVEQEKEIFQRFQVYEARKSEKE